MKVLLTLILVAHVSFAAPAYNGTNTFTQPDGTVVHYKMQGDEYLHWMESEDGEILLHNEEQKCFEYATIKNGNLTKSGVMFTHKIQRSKKSKSTFQLKKVSRQDLDAIYIQKRQKRFKKHPKNTNK